MAHIAAAFKLDPVPSFKLKSMEGGGDAPSTAPLLRIAASGRTTSQTVASAPISMASMRTVVSSIFLAFLLGAAVAGLSIVCANVGGIHAGQAPAYEFAAGSCILNPSGTYTCSNLPAVGSKVTHGRQLAAIPCNQFNVAVSPTTFQKSTKSGDTTVGIWQATITNQCAAGAVTDLVVSTNGRYNPAGGNPRAQTNLQNCSPPTVNLKTGQTNGPVTCHVVLPGGMLGAGQSMVVTYTDNFLNGSPPQFTFAVSSAAYGAPVTPNPPTSTQQTSVSSKPTSTPSPTPTHSATTPSPTTTPPPTTFVPCNQFNVAVSPTTFVGTTKSGDSTVGIWQATITNQCAAGKVTNLVVSTNGRYNAAGGDPRTQTNLQNCSPPTVNLKTGQTNGPVTCQAVLPNGALGAGQSMTISYVDNFLNGSPPQFSFAASTAAYAPH